MYLLRFDAAEIIVQVRDQLQEPRERQLLSRAKLSDQGLQGEHEMHVCHRETRG